MKIVTFDDEMIGLTRQFQNTFRQAVPFFMIPPSETDEGVKRSIKRCLKEERNLLPEIYAFDYSLFY